MPRTKPQITTDLTREQLRFADIVRSRSGSGAHAWFFFSAPVEASAATGCYIGEGFDDPRLDTLFLAMPVSWKGTLIQYSSRLHRYSPSKTEVRVYDYVDSNVPVLARTFDNRMVTNKAIGYSV